MNLHSEGQQVVKFSLPCFLPSNRVVIILTKTRLSLQFPVLCGLFSVGFCARLNTEELCLVIVCLLDWGLIQMF